MDLPFRLRPLAEMEGAHRRRAARRRAHADRAAAVAREAILPHLRRDGGAVRAAAE